MSSSCWTPKKNTTDLLVNKIVDQLNQTKSTLIYALTLKQVHYQVAPGLTVIPHVHSEKAPSHTKSCGKPHPLSSLIQSWPRTQQKDPPAQVKGSRKQEKTAIYI